MKRKTFFKERKVKILTFVVGFLLLMGVFTALAFNTRNKQDGVRTPASIPASNQPADNQLISATVPAGKLDLTNWKLTLPIDNDKDDSADEIKQPQLSSFDMAPYFISSADGVVFRANVGGATTDNSGYPRSELREMADNGRKRAIWSNENGSHSMEIKQAITHLPVVKPEVVAGQIHDDSDDVVMIRLEKNRLFVEADGKNIGDLDQNYQLGTVFTVKIAAGNGTIKVFYNDALKVTYNKKGSDYYFKAGCYTQSNIDKGDDPAAYGEVIIYDLKVSHI